MRDERCGRRCNSEAGTVIIFVAAGMVALLLLLALAIDQGIRFSGRTQLQQLVDASAQAALMEFSRAGADRDDARAAAQRVASNTLVTQGGFPGSNLVVEFGRFDFASGGFVPETMPVAPPQAVRVTANKLGANSFQGLGGAPVAADANSVALLRCRNVVFVQDVSSSFREDIGKVQDALRQAVAILELQGGFGGVETRVGLVAFRNIVVPAGSTDTLLSPSDTRIDDAIEALDDPTVLCGTPMMERGNTIIVPACVGSDMRAGLVEARRLLQPGNGKNAACEDLVLTVSDGVPCKILEENLDDSLPLFARFFGFDVVFGPALPGEPQGGGSTAAETLAFVNANMRSTGSIAVLTANSNQPTNPDPDDLNSFLGTCPTANTSTSQQTVNEDFANQLITGFGQPFASTKTAEAMAAELIAAMQTIPPVVVR